MKHQPSPSRKKITHLLFLLSNTALAAAIFAFFVLIFQGISLIYLTGLIITYLVTTVLWIILDTGNKKASLEEEFKDSHNLLFGAANIITLGLLFLLIQKYQLSQYSGYILVTAGVILNLILVEYIFHSISRFFRTTPGKWITRTILLLVVSGGVLLIKNTLQTPSDFLSGLDSKIASAPRKTTSEITGTLSTIDPNANDSEVVDADILSTDSPGITHLGEIGVDRKDTTFAEGVEINDSEGIKSEATGNLATNPPNTSSSGINSGTESTDTSPPTTRVIDITRPGGLRVSTGAVKSTNTGTTQISNTGSATVKNPIRVDSIESLDGNARARIENGQIIVEVIPASASTGSGGGATVGSGMNTEIVGEGTSGGNTGGGGGGSNASFTWNIRSAVNTAGGNGGLRGVVISAPIITPAGGAYSAPQSISLSSEGASGIFFTIDGSEPSCSGKGSAQLSTTEKTFTLRAISCFGGNKIRGPISTQTFELK